MEASFTWEGNAQFQRAAVAEGLADSKSLSHILKQKIIGGQLTNTGAQNQLVAIGPKTTKESRAGGLRSGHKGRSINGFYRRQIANRSRGPDHGYLDFYVEKVSQHRQELSQRHVQNKGSVTMHKTAYGNFTKKSVFKDPNLLIFTNASTRNAEDGAMLQ